MVSETKIIYRRASLKDLKEICKFVDYWLSGRGLRLGISNAGNDYFISPSQHRTYLKYCIVYIALKQTLTTHPKIVGWVVKERTNVLIHLLIAGDERKKGIGQSLLKIINPDIIRSKSDQMTGNPAEFYEQNGYMKISKIKVGKKSNIDLMVKKLI